MHFIRNLFTLFVFLTVAACGDTDSSGNTSSEALAFEEGATARGTVYGETLTPVTWLAGTSSGYSFNRAEWSSEHTVIKIVDAERDCGEGDFEGTRSVPTNSLLLDLFDDPSRLDSRVNAPGTFEVSSITEPISSSRRAIATFVHDAVVGTSFLMTARSGTVTVSTADAHGISGTFDLVFMEDDRLTGTFGASHCEAPFPPVGIQTPGNTPEMGSVQINVQLVGASPAELVLVASGPWISTSYLTEVENSKWQLDSALPTGDYDATFTANDEHGNTLCQFSLEFSVTKDEPTKIDTIVSCAVVFE